MITNDVATAAAAAHHAPASGDDDQSQVERGLDWLSRNFERQPSLAEAAGHVGLSEYHFQRLFTRQVGLSPKKYVQFLTLERAKEALAKSRSVLDAAYASGLSGPGRLHDLFVNVEAMTPGEYKHRGEGLTIRYGTHPSPFGQCLIMRTDRGVCGLAFTSPARHDRAFADLARGFESATFVEDAGAVAGVDVRRSGRRRRPRAASARYPVPDQGVARAADDSAGMRHVVRRSRPPRRSAGRLACGRQRDRVQPRRMDHSLPPGHPRVGCSRGVSVGRRPQARDAERGSRRRGSGTHSTAGAGGGNFCLAMIDYPGEFGAILLTALQRCHALRSAAWFPR